MIVKVLGGYLEVVADAPAPPGIWGGGNVPMPTPPIAGVPGAPGYPGGGGQPPGIWGPPGPWPTPPIHMPPGQGGGHPAHPIAPGGPPPTVWPGPGRPEHPIYLPPGIWPNPPEGQAPLPEHPIVIPPPPGAPDGTPPLEVKTVWTPETGWQVVLVPTGEHVAPSK